MPMDKTEEGTSNAGSPEPRNIRRGIVCSSDAPPANVKLLRTKVPAKAESPMVCTVDGSSKAAMKLVANAEAPIVSSEDPEPIENAVSPRVCEKALFPIETTLSGRVKLVRPDNEKASSPMVKRVGVPVKTTVRRLPAWVKARAPIVSTLPGMTMVSIVWQPSKTPDGMAVCPSGTVTRVDCPKIGHASGAGDAVGDGVGAEVVGEVVGADVDGLSVGDTDGAVVLGPTVGAEVLGARVGDTVGADVRGDSVGVTLGAVVLGDPVGDSVGVDVLGLVVGPTVGETDGCGVGEEVVGEVVGVDVVGDTVGVEVVGDVVGERVVGARVGEHDAT